MAWMKKEGIVIWLDESVEILVKRLVEEKAHRPLIANLSEKDLTKFIQDKLVERHSFYSQADYRLSSEQINDAKLKQIIQQHA
jgi:shikimate kinase